MKNGNDFSNHNLQSNIFYKKYYINNQNDYSIDKDYINDSKNHQIDYDKNRNYKSLYYKYKKKYFSLKKQIGGTTRYLKSMDDLSTSKDKKLEPYLTFSNEKLKSIDQDFITKQIIAIAEKHKIIPSNSSIVDLGSGHSNTSLSLSFYFKKVLGLDISEDM